MIGLLYVMALVTILTIVAIADLLLIMMLSQAHRGIEAAAAVAVQEKETTPADKKRGPLTIEIPAEDHHHQLSPVEKDSLVVNGYILCHHHVGEVEI